MREDTSLIRSILFNILVILTIILIYFLFFPKKSYIEKKLDNKFDMNEIEIQNIKNMEIAGLSFFNENKNTTKITLSELIDKKLILELKDKDNNVCSKDSYIEKKDGKLIIYLKCNEKETINEIEIKNNENDKTICIYEYIKQEPEKYTEWSEFSDWQKEEKKSNELIQVETKIKKEKIGTTKTTETKKIEINAKANIILTCPNGYKQNKDACIKEVKSSSIPAQNNKCPNDKKLIRYELNGNKCDMISIRYMEPINKKIYYTCPDGYELSGTTCVTNKNIEKEIDEYKEITYYRYRTRKKIESKYDVKWSIINDYKLINDEYIMSKEIYCEF